MARLNAAAAVLLLLCISPPVLAYIVKDCSDWVTITFGCHDGKCWAARGASVCYLRPTSGEPTYDYCVSDWACLPGVCLKKCYGADTFAEDHDRLSSNQ